jgi:hypothetical protein
MVCVCVTRVGRESYQELWLTNEHRMYIIEPNLPTSVATWQLKWACFLTMVKYYQLSMICHLRISSMWVPQAWFDGPFLSSSLISGEASRKRLSSVMVKGPNQSRSSFWLTGPFSTSEALSAFLPWANGRAEEIQLQRHQSALMSGLRKLEAKRAQVKKKAGPMQSTEKNTCLYNLRIVSESSDCFWLESCI